MKILELGDQALLVEVVDAAAALALYLRARAAGVVAADIVPAARTVLFDGVTPATRAWLDGVDTPASRRSPAGSPARSRADTPGAGPLIEVPTTYDGPDLADTARLLGLSPAGLVEQLGNTELQVAFCGFAPGFAYCTGLPWVVPRLPTPRPRVPAGSVALAGGYAGAYPSSSPGGWRIVGHTDATLWDAARPEPALLGPGTRVRFVNG